ncbi:MAG: type 1 glutamine amidotransferase [Actinomycetota bacterium]
MRSVVVVQHEPSVPPGSIAGVLAEEGVPYRVVEAWHAAEWPAGGEVGALIVMGGTMNVDELERYPFLRASRRLTADALERGTPTLGVCLGSQMMARVLGGDVYRTRPRNAFFSSLEVLAPDPVLEPFAGGTPVLQFHEDTFTLPSGATALARSARSGLLQAFRYGDNAYAVQFHFEVDDGIVGRWCDNIGGDALDREWATSRKGLLAEGSRLLAAQHAAGRALVRRFLDAAGGRAAAGPEGPAAGEMSELETGST